MIAPTGRAKDMRNLAPQAPPRPLLDIFLSEKFYGRGSYEETNKGTFTVPKYWEIFYTYIMLDQGVKESNLS